MEALMNAVTQAVAPHANAGTQDTPGGVSPEGTIETPGTTAESVQEMISPRLSAVIKRESALLKRERELKDLERRLKSEGEGKLSREELLNEFKNDYEEDPYEFMNKHGFSYEKLQNRILGGDDSVKFSKLERELQRLQSKLEEKDKEKVKNEEESSLNELEAKKNEAIKYIQDELGDSEEFELVVSENAVNEVYDLITSYFQQTGKMLSIKEAAGMVEKELEEGFRKRLEYRKVKKWVTPSSDPSQSSLPPQSSLEPKETKTITSDLLHSSGGSVSDLELSEEERMAKAIRLFRGQQ